MRLEWLLNPVTFYSGASLCLLTSLALFVSVKVELARARFRATQSDTARESELVAVRGLEAEIESLRESVRHLEAVPPGRPIGAGIDLTKRAQALRMHRRGESVPSIAAALETPANEISLLLKVHSLSSQVQAKAS